MVSINVVAGKSLLEGYIKTPPVGLCELVWNAFDEDATLVAIRVERGPLGGIETIQVIDNGLGMNIERAEKAFSHVGDSWKLPPGTTSEGGRPVHGKFGRGRYAAFSIGSVVRWISTSKAVEGGALATIEVKGVRSNLSRFEVENRVDEAESSGTTVELNEISAEALAAFDESEGLRQRLLTEFALHLNRHPDFRIDFLGSQIDPTTVIVLTTEVLLELPADISGPAKLTVIEWNLSNVERRLYLCNSGGAVIDEMSPGIQAVGAEFTAYLEWDGFVRDQGLIMENDGQTDAGRVVGIARAALREYMAESTRRREAETVSRWEAEGVWPYKDKPQTTVERAAQDTFKVIAMAASRTVEESRSQRSKALALGLLRETFERDPEKLLPILKQFSQLPAARIDELAAILDRTTLAQLIAVGKEVGDRIDFLQGLNAILFDRKIKKRLLERRQLHRILAHETWIFGEQWSLTGDDQRLAEVLKKYLEKLGRDVDLASAKTVLREDGSDAIPDLVLGRQLQTRENHFANLVVELKRPNHKLNDEDVSQLRSYASAIAADERFDQRNSSWEFWLIGNATSRTVDEMREQDGRPFGEVQSSKKYKILVRTWAEMLGDADHRLKFVQHSLQYESGRDAGLASLRDRYGQYLPDSAKESDNSSELSEQVV